MRVQARTVEPKAGGPLAGVKLDLDGAAPVDKTPTCDVNTEPLCAGPGWQLLLARERAAARHGLDDARLRRADQQEQEQLVRTAAATPASPGRSTPTRRTSTRSTSIRPRTKTPVMRTIGDYRQLNDALFHAGTGSGSKYEYIDEANRLRVLHPRHDQGRGRRAVLRRRDPQPRRRRPAHARRRDRPAGHARAQRGRGQHLHVDGQEHRRDGFRCTAAGRRRWTTRTRTSARTSTA